MFDGWNNFFYLIGAAGAGLIGLLFVVVTLTTGSDRDRALRGASIYLTPTALHFAMVLSLSAVALAPRLAPSTTAALIGLGALVGLGHGLRSCLAIGSPRPGFEPPHWSDFWCYGAAPAAIYAGLAVAAIALWSRADWAVHAIAALLLALLLVGIRNAWDLVTWMAPVRRREPE
jgi:hypothetical protein